MSRPSNEDDYVDVDVHCHARTRKAALLSIDGQEGNATWIPLSQMNDVPERDKDGVAVIKRWIAEREGMI